MKSNNENKKPNDSQIKKENQDLSNIPAATEKVETENEVKKEIERTSKLQNEGKTDNTEKISKK